MRFKSGIRAGLWWIFPVSLLAVSPFFFRGTSNGHDLTFHVNSWIEVVHQWKQGVLYPHWAALANFGNGEPRFVFYPPISWTLGALLGLLLPWQAAPGALIFLICVAAGISMYLFASEWLDTRTAVLAAVFYAVNPYQLLVAYERDAFAEMIASIWIPGILLFALRQRGGFARNTLLLAFHIALVWLTNIPAALIASYLLAFVVVIRALQERRAEPLLRAAAAVLLGLALAGFYLVPAIYEQRWIQVGQAVAAGATPRDNLLFVQTGDRARDAVLLRTSIFAVLEFVVVAVLAWLASPLRRTSRRLYLMLLALSVLVVFLLTPLSIPIWTYAPKLVFVQFPWRWLLVLSVPLASLCAVAAARTRFASWIPAFVLPILILVSYTVFHQKIYDEDRPIALAEAYDSGTGYEGTDEYTPLEADTSTFDQPFPRVAIQLTRPHTEPHDAPLAHSQTPLWKAEHKRILIDSKVPTRDTFRLLAYPAWQIKVDGAITPYSVNEADGRLQLDLPAGHHDIQIDYHRTPDRLYGLLLSIVAFLVTVVLWLLSRKTEPNTETPSHGAF